MENSVKLIRTIAKMLLTIGIIGAALYILVCFISFGREGLAKSIFESAVIIIADLLGYAILLATADITEAICQIRDAQRSMIGYQVPQKTVTSTSAVKTTPQTKPKVINQSTTCPHCGNAPTSSPCEMCGKTF
ncbi:MAG: hypothetical protein IJ370_04350 [Oscillospiraceae bacterium]|nr:hypothetical protein [Oscillospiraceae bacterium]